MAASANAVTGDFKILIEGTAGRFNSDQDDVGNIALFLMSHLEQITGAKLTQARMMFAGKEQNWNNLITSDRNTYDTTYGSLVK